MIPTVAHSVNPYLPNSGSWIYHQIRFLAAFRPIVLTKRTENIDQFPPPTMYSIYALPFLRRNMEKVFFKVGGPPFRLHREALRREKAVLLHSHFSDMAIRNISLAKEVGIPHVASFYGSDIWARERDPEFRKNFQNLFESASFFLVEGPAMAGKVVSMGAPDKMVRVVRIGIDISKIPFIPRHPPDDGKITILMAGRSVEKKGHWYGLLAFERISRDFPSARLLLIIGGRSREEKRIVLKMRRFIAEREIGNRVQWSGFLSYEEYLKSIRTAHIFLQPSVQAGDGDAEGGAPVTLTELSASGMPIVATRHCDIPEVVLDGKSGLLAKERDVEELAGKLSEMISSPEKWEAMGKAGRDHVEKFFDIRCQVKELEQIYSDCLGGAG
jgi:colanic acid/amylovoran biosynthesis glycosyltransferase